MERRIHPDLEVAVCGLDCSRCSIHNRTEEELVYWREKGVDTGTIRCDGCRGERDARHWSPDCDLLLCCADRKKLDYCCQCDEFPCPAYDSWALEYEHHNGAKQRMMDFQKQLKKQGKS